MAWPAALVLAIAGALHATTCQGAMTFEARLALSLQEESSGQVSKETPIQRVVKLLEEMKAQMEKEAETDSEAYDKMVCWCETNEKAKTKAIEDAEAKIEELMAEVEMRAARDGESQAKIEHMKKEIAKQKEALATAVSIREKERAAFREEESETVQAVTMLKNAILVLGKHNSGFLQLSPAVQQSLTAALQWTALKHEEMQNLRVERGLLPFDGSANAPTATSLLALAEQSLGQAGGNDLVLRSLRGGKELKQSKVPPRYAARVLASAAAQSASFAQQPAGFQSYAPQSSQIFGILTQMKEDFEANLSESQKAELKAEEDFVQLKAALEKQINSNMAMLDDMEEEFGANVKALSDAKEDLAATRESRGADVEFLRNLKLKCQDLDHDWNQRTKARGEELRAVSETIAMLTEDDARELFLKKMGTGGAASLLQEASSRTAAKRARQQAAALLMRAARSLQAPDFSDLAAAWRSGEDRPHEQLAVVAVQVQLDAFTKVKKAIDDMVAELKKQQEEEVKFKAYCTAELNDNEKVTYETNQTLQELKAKISSLADIIAKCEETIEEAKTEIKRMEVELKKASEIRKEENGNFQEEVMDQRAVQNILAKAIDRMRLVYKKKEALMQQDPNPPVQFQPYKQNAGASPVIGLMEQIVEDSKAVEKDTLAAEQEAQKAYASFVVDSDSSIKDLNAQIEERTKAKAAAEVEKEETEASKDNTETELDGLAQAAADLHKECDFVLLNFDIRQKARLQEIEALQGAKAFLSGMKDGL